MSSAGQGVRRWPCTRQIWRPGALVGRLARVSEVSTPRRPSAALCSTPRVEGSYSATEARPKDRSCAVSFLGLQVCASFAVGLAH